MAQFKFNKSKFDLNKYKVNKPNITMNNKIGLNNFHDDEVSPFKNNSSNRSPRSNQEDPTDLATFWKNYVINTPAKGYSSEKSESQYHSGNKNGAQNNTINTDN